jgi:rhamnosyl/mannosyltransferase
MRVLHVYKDYPPVLGGIEGHLQLLAEGQAARGLEVTVLVTGPDRRTVVELVQGVRLVRTATLLRAGSTPFGLDFFAWLRRLEAEIIHLHFPYPPAELGHLLLVRRGRLVITYHSDIVRQRILLRLYLPFLRRILARADRIITTSPNYARSSPYLQAVLHKCEVIPLGIRVEGFLNADLQQVRHIRAQYGAPLLLFVGRLRYYKGLDYLLRAMRDAPGALLVIGSGPMEAEWRRVSLTSGLAGRVHFLGDVSNERLPDFYHAADLFVLPSSQRSEAYGIVQLEAMAAGLPVIATELETGTSFVNVDGVTGLVVPPRNSTALAAAIMDLVNDPARRRRMGEAGRRRSEQDFSHQAMVDKTIDLYRKLTATLTRNLL